MDNTHGECASIHGCYSEPLQLGRCLNYSALHAVSRSFTRTCRPPVESDKCSDEARIHSEVWDIITMLAVRGNHIGPQTMVLYVTDYRLPFYAAWEL